MINNLDKIDLRILYELDKNARIPETKLAKLINRSKESVRYRIKKLEENKVIEKYSIWIDPTKLGFISAKIYLNLANKPSQKEEFKKFVKKDKRLFWFGIAEGAWNVGLTYFVKSNREFFELKNGIFSKFKDLIIDSHTGMLVSVHVSDKTFLHNTNTEWKTMFDIPENIKLDEYEKKILKELFYNSRISLVEISRRLNLSVDIIRNRIKKMESKKIIFCYKANINFSLLGLEFYKTFLYFRNLTKEDEIKIMNYTKNHPNIIHLVKQISPWDIELEIMCESYLKYNEIISELTKKFPESINKIETAIMGEDYVFPAKEMIFE